MNLSALKASLSQLILNIAPEADIDSLDPNDDLRDELDLDSIDFVRLLTTIEQTLEVTIPESDYSQINTLQKMLDFIVKHSPSPSA